MDLFFRHDVTIATDVGKAFTMRGGEVLTGAPGPLAARLLKRPDVLKADPEFDGKVIDFAAPGARELEPALALIVSPPLDEARIIKDEERAFKAADAMRARAKRLAEAKRGADA